MLAVDHHSKEWRRASLQRKKQDKTNRRNPMAQELRSPKFNRRIVETLKERGGSRNLLSTLVYYDEPTKEVLH